MDRLDLIDRVRASISLGESHFREFKSAFHGPPDAKTRRKLNEITGDIAETLVAFGNADGGELIVGVEDGGSITGIPHSVADVEILMAAPTNGVMPENPLLLMNSDVLDVDGQKLLYFCVAKGNRGPHVTTAGKCLRRNDRVSLPIHPQTLELGEQERKSRVYERDFLPSLSSSDLDVALIEKTCKEANLDFSPEKYLQYTQLAEFDQGKLRLRRAAGLLFAKNIAAVHPRCQVRIVRAPGSALRTGGNYETAEDFIESDNVLRLIPKAWERLRKHLARDRFLGEGRFRTTVLYPEGACIESLVNAVAHRDYSIEGRGVEIVVHDDSMTVSSPGSLLTTVSLKDLTGRTGVHESRNPLMARVLRDAGHMRELGEGIRRIFDLMHESDLVNPRIEVDHQSFKITLENRTIFTPEDLGWLTHYDMFNLSRDERLVMLLGRSRPELSQRDISDGLGLTDLADYQAITTELTVTGLLVRTRTQNAISAALKKYRSRKDVPRFAIRPPADMESLLAQTRQALIGIGPFNTADGATVQSLRDRLPDGHPYKRSTAFVRTLQRLGYIELDGRATDKLRGLWEGAKGGAVELGELARPRSEERAVAPGPYTLPAGRSEKMGSASHAKTAPAAPKPTADAVPTPSPSASPRTAAISGVRRPADARPQSRLFVTNLPSETSLPDLYALFSRCGSVMYAKLLPQASASVATRAAIVTMETKASAEQAIKELNGELVHGRPVLVTWATASKKTSEPT